MIDIHCHILPGLDDGPATIEESIEMCRMAEKDGIRIIVASPHYSPGTENRTREDIAGHIKNLETALKEQNIKVIILPGADIKLFPELADRVKEEPHLTVNSTGKYLLAEFPFEAAPDNWNLLEPLLAAGITPIITHPERHRWFLKHREAMYALVHMGALVQITAMSLIGRFGEDARQFCNFLLKHNLAHVIATDAHSVEHRPPLLSEALKAAAFQIGEERAKPLVTTIPQAIIEGKLMRVPVPLSPPRQKKSLLQNLISKIRR